MRRRSSSRASIAGVVFFAGFWIVLFGTRYVVGALLAIMDWMGRVFG